MEDDASLPKATLNAFIKEITTSKIKTTHEYCDLILEIAKEYIKHVSAEANLKCLGDGKKTISPEFIFAALKEIQMQKYLEELEAAHNSYLEETNEKNKKKTKFSNLENREELEAQQQKLFEMSRMYNLGNEEPLKNTENESKQIEIEEQSKINTEFLKPKGGLFQKEDEDFETY